MKKQEKFPSNICIRLNRTCNLSCVFCLADKMEKELSIDKIKLALEYLKLHDIKKACLGGGEPTLRSDFIEIVKYCFTLGLETRIYSNLFDIDKVVDNLIQYPVSVTTSIHGNQMFHDSITRVGAYESTYKNINKLISNNINVAIHTVLMKSNFCYAEEIINNAIDVGVKKISFQTLIPRGRGYRLFNKNENAEDVIQKLYDLYPLAKKYEKKIKIKFINLYEKNYYVLETNGCLYLQKPTEEEDIFIQRIV